MQNKVIQKKSCGFLHYIQCVHYSSCVHYIIIIWWESDVRCRRSFQKRVVHKILNGGKVFQTEIRSPNGNFVEHTCLHICAKYI